MWAWFRGRMRIVDSLIFRNKWVFRKSHLVFNCNYFSVCSIQYQRQVTGDTQTTERLDQVACKMFLWPLCLAWIWMIAEFFIAKLLLQYIHLNGFSPVCFRRWRVITPLRVVSLPQHLHLHRPFLGTVTWLSKHCLDSVGSWQTKHFTSTLECDCCHLSCNSKNKRTVEAIIGQVSWKGKVKGHFKLTVI